MTLRRKLLLTMLIPSLPILLVGVIGVLSLGHLEKAAGRILANNYRSIKEARRLESLLHRIELTPGAPSPEAVAAFERGLRICEANITEEGETEYLKRIRAGWTAFVQGSTQDRSGAAPTSAATMISDIGGLMKLNELAMERSEQETRRTGLVTVLGTAASSCLALLGLILFAAVSANRISRPVIEVASSLHSALSRQGDASPAISIDTDEIALLRSEQADLLERLASYEDEQARRFAHLQGRLRMVMERVLEGIVFIDDAHRILAANRVARAILGISLDENAKVEELELPRGVRAVFSAISRDEFDAERDLDEISREVDGEARVYRPRVLAIPGPEKAPDGYLVLFWDVTEQRRFEEARQRFIAMLSHQLKTPMTSLSMSVNLLKEKLPVANEEQNELLSIAAEDCRNLARLVADLIDASKGISADLRIERRSVDLIRLLRSALRPLMPQAEERGIRLVLPAATSMLDVRVDPVKFPWVVTNITGNALRYTARGGSVTVGLVAAKDRVEIAVGDTGAGIREEDMERIFDAHVSVDAVPDRSSHGLGLTIAREIVEAHGGTIWVESRLGEGSTFHIQIPI